MKTPDSTPDYYEAGKNFSRLVLLAFDAAPLSLEAASDIATGADRKLWPLADVYDPNHLRDFIAGMARALEDALSALGVYMDTSVPTKPLSDKFLRLEALLDSIQE